jgi:hypothetical protein
MMKHKIIILLLLILVFFEFFTPNAFRDLSFKVYSQYYTVEDYPYKLLRLDILIIFMNIIIIISSKLFLQKNNFLKYFIYILLIIGFIPNSIILIDHINYDILNPSEVSIFYTLKETYSIFAHIFFILPLMSYVVGCLLLFLPTRSQ